MSTGGWSISQYEGSYFTNAGIGFQDFPIRRVDGTWDMHEYWDPDRRGIAVSHPGYYNVTWAVRVNSNQAGNNMFSINILPEVNAVSVYGSHALYRAGNSYLHSGAKLVKCDVLTDSDTGVISMQVDGYEDRIEIMAAQMHCRWVSGL